MLEIRIHGRGGQGNVVAAYLLAIAAIDDGRYAQAFPAFGAERRGAPVAAFVRVSDAPIRRRCEIREPRFLIIQDQALLDGSGVTAGLAPHGGILVNASERMALADRNQDHPLVTVPATRLALEHLGQPVPNTALLSAFLTLTGLLPLRALADALAERFQGETLERNRHLIEAAADAVEAGLWRDTSRASRA